MLWYIHGVILFYVRCRTVEMGIIYNLNKDKVMNSEQINNKIIIVKENGEQIVNPQEIEGLKINIKGDNNIIKIYEPYFFSNAQIFVTGDIEITIMPNCRLGHGFIIRKTRNTKKNKLVIGKDFQSGPGCVLDLTDAGDILIGDGAKWSWNIYVKSDDTHPVFDITTKKCLNKSTAVVIGNHVWICMNVTILKNSEIQDNSVVGACAVVAKKFEEKNVAIAGNPAKICKRNVDWTHGAIEHYIMEQQESI